MIRKLSLLLTIAAVVGLVIALQGCGKKGGLERPPKDASAPALDRLFG